MTTENFASYDKTTGNQLALGKSMHCDLYLFDCHYFDSMRLGKMSSLTRYSSMKTWQAAR